MEKAAWMMTFLLPDRFGENELKTTAFNTALEMITSYHDYVWLKYSLLLKRQKVTVDPPVRTQLEKAPYFPDSHMKIAAMLTLIEHAELLCEILVTRLEDKYRRLCNSTWVVIAIIEITKCVLRLKLLYLGGGSILAHRGLPSRSVENEVPEGDVVIDANYNTKYVRPRPNLMDYSRESEKKKKKIAHVISDNPQKPIYTPFLVKFCG